jgi:tetratricopeptide (TPR) repeat protein
MTVKLNPADSMNWNIQCWYRGILGQLDEALKDCNKSLELKPGEGATLDSRGLVYLKLGKLDEAIADYDAALKDDPTIAGSFYGRGLAKKKKGDAAGAAADFVAAQKLDAKIEEKFKKYGVKP